MPCLWFSLHGLPDHERPLDVDTVFRRLVPEQYKDGLRKVGGLVGGISADVRLLSVFLLGVSYLENLPVNFRGASRDTRALENQVYTNTFLSLGHSITR